jgi:hypothetical protein
MTRARVIVGIAAVAAGTTGAVISAPAVSAHHRPLPGRPRTTTTTTAPPAAPGLTAPTNLRVTALAPTSVTFQWDHSQGTQGGCTIPIAMYYVYVDGTLRGSTYLGSPVAFVANLRPGGTYGVAVQGRDNCSGRLSALSATLTVTTPLS